MYTLEQKIDILLRYIVSDDVHEKEVLKNMATEALMVNPRKNVPERDHICVEDLIVAALADIGMPCHLRGYTYCIKAISLCIEDPSYRNDVHKRLYWDIATSCNTTATRVERALRHAIETSFYRMSYEDVTRIYGRMISADRGKLTNLEFIAFWSGKIARDIRNGVGV